MPNSVDGIIVVTASPSSQTVATITRGEPSRVGTARRACAAAGEPS